MQHQHLTLLGREAGEQWEAGGQLLRGKGLVGLGAPLRLFAGRVESRLKAF